MQHNGEAIEFRVPTRETLATIHYAIDFQLIEARKDLEHARTVAEYDSYNGYLLGLVEDQDYAVMCRDKVERLEKSLDWLRSFQVTCLSISTNLSKTDTKSEDQWNRS